MFSFFCPPPHQSYLTFDAQLGQGHFWRFPHWWQVLGLWSLGPIVLDGKYAEGSCLKFWAAPQITSLTPLPILIRSQEYFELGSILTSTLQWRAYASCCLRNQLFGWVLGVHTAHQVFAYRFEAYIWIVSNIHVMSCETIVSDLNLLGGMK